MGKKKECKKKKKKKILTVSHPIKTNKNELVSSTDGKKKLKTWHFHYIFLGLNSSDHRPF